MVSAWTISRLKRFKKHLEPSEAGPKSQSGMCPASDGALPRERDMHTQAEKSLKWGPTEHVPSSKHGAKGRQMGSAPDDNCLIDSSLRRAQGHV